MGGEVQVAEEAQIPLLDFSSEILNSDEEAGDGDDQIQRWKDLCNKVREALEIHGCFLMFYEKISTTLREEMFTAMKNVFDLPEETKNKHTNPKPYRSYMGNCPIIPLLESFGIDNENGVDIASQAFTNLMWPQGNPNFCETLNSMSSKMIELNYMILKMIFESFGTGKHYNSHAEESTSVFRIMKYKVPPNKTESAIGLVPHTDKNTLTILCQNDVQGLEVVNKHGDWVPVIFPSNAFIVIAGDGLKAWSNGRIVAAKHKVVMSGDRERYSFGVFSMPKEGARIEVPHELVDNEHPLVYRPFKFSDYFTYFVSNISDDALETFAGV